MAAATATTSSPSDQFFTQALSAGYSPQAITNYLSSKGQGTLAQVYFNTNPSAGSGNSSFSDVMNALKNYAGSVASDVKSDVNEGAQDLTSTIGQSGFDQAQGGFQATGEAAKAVMSPLTDAITGIANGLAGNKTVQAVADSKVGSALTDAGSAVTTNPLTDKLNSWAQQYPDAAKDLGALGNIATLGTADDISEEGVDMAGNTAKTVGDKVTSAVQNTVDETKDALTTAPQTPEDILKARTADATPTYSKKMVGQFVQNSDGDVVPRVNEGEGLFGNRTVTTSKGEAAAGEELANIKNYPDNGTDLQKSQAISKAISQEAEAMKGGLAAEDKADPLDQPAEKAAMKDTVIKNMPDEIQKLIAEGKPMPKTAAGRYYQSVLDAVDKYDGTRVGKLELRQTVDSAYENARGKLAYGTDSQNLLDESHSDIRDSINQDLASKTKSTDTQASLAKQSRLYRAKDVLDQKAAAEATSKYGRFMQKHPAVKTGARIITRRAVSIPLSAAATATGIYEIGKHSSK